MPNAAAGLSLDLETDVLVIGGGPAGAWAAIEAARTGAKVAVVDKGFCGSSGATAASGTQIWYIPPDPAERERAMAYREDMGGFLADRGWMTRVLDRTFDCVNQLADWGYPFPVDSDGAQHRLSVQGPEYMRLMRKRVKQAGAKIFDQSPALELLLDGNGGVAGAMGLRRQDGGFWRIRAGAVVMATGGCAFLSKALGCDVLTGDGYLMAAEAGADLSGMEFSNAYAISHLHGSVTKTALYSWAVFTDESGEPIQGAASKGGRSVIARALAKGRVFARLEGVDRDMQVAMRHGQPNFFLPFDRQGIDPFVDRFPITLRLEGTVRGTGGLRVTDHGCATAVPGLYAAGDAATREPICGGFTGGGSHNAAWAMSSGSFAGTAAGDFARMSRSNRKAELRQAGTAALRARPGRPFDANALKKAVQDEVFPFERNYFRSEERLTASLGRLDRLWRAAADADAAVPEDLLRARQSAAMLATARWMYRSALARKESRGMHRREDFPKRSPEGHHHLTVGGLDEVWVRKRPAGVRPALEAAE